MDSLHFTNGAVISDLTNRAFSGIVKGTAISGMLDSISDKIPTSSEVVNSIANTFDKIQEKINDIKNSITECTN